MIKLNAMRFPLFIPVFVIMMVFIQPTIGFAQTIPTEPLVISPRGGEAIIGSVEISGITEIPGFTRTEVEFRYAKDPKNTWFLVAESDQTVNPGKIAEWNTSTITDGTYDLRVTVFTRDGDNKSITVSGLLVRNYSPVESPTAVPSGEVIKMETTVTPPVPTRTPHPTLSILPNNPAVFSNSDLNYSIFRGAAAGIGFFVVFAIYWIVKKSLL